MRNELSAFLDDILNCSIVTDTFLDNLKSKLRTIEVFHDEVSEFIFSIKDDQILGTFSMTSEIVLKRILINYKTEPHASDNSIEKLGKSIINLTNKAGGSDRKAINDQASIKITQYLSSSIMHLDITRNYDKCKQLLDSIQIWATIAQKNNEMQAQTEKNINEVQKLFQSELAKSKADIRQFTEQEIALFSDSIEKKATNQTIKMDNKIDGFSEKMTTLSITILGIFTGIAFLVTGGINLTSTILSSAGSMASIMMRWSLLGFGIFSLLLLLLYGVSDLIGKKIFDSKSIFIRFIYVICVLTFLIGIIFDNI